MRSTTKLLPRLALVLVALAAFTAPAFAAAPSNDTLASAKLVTLGFIVAFGEFQGECDGTTQRWTVVVEPESGKFSDAKLETTSFGVASVSDLGTAYQINQKVKLRGGRM